MTVDCLPQLCVTAHLRRILLFSRFQVPLQFFRRPWLHILVASQMIKIVLHFLLVKLLVTLVSVIYMSHVLQFRDLHCDTKQISE